MKPSIVNANRVLIENYLYTQTLMYMGIMSEYTSAVQVRGRTKCRWMEDEILLAYWLLETMKRWLLGTSEKDENFTDIRGMQIIETKFNKLVNGSATLFYIEDVKDWK